MEQEITYFRRCWNNHVIQVDKPNTDDECPECKSPLLEHLYDTDEQGLIYEAKGDNAWGDSIVVDWPNDKEVSSETIISGHGWKQRIPHEGDYIKQEMKSGKHIILRITKVEPCGDPADMFFFECNPINYLEDMKDFEAKYEKDVRKKVDFFI